MNRRENPVLTELRSRSTRVRGRELQGERKIKKLMACPGWHLGLRTLAGQATWQGSCRDEALAVGGAGSILGAPGTELSKTQLETGVRKLCGSAATLGINTLHLSDLPPPPPHEVPTVGTAAALGWSGACRMEAGKQAERAWRGVGRYCQRGTKLLPAGLDGVSGGGSGGRGHRRNAGAGCAAWGRQAEGGAAEQGQVLGASNPGSSQTCRGPALCGWSRCWHHPVGA